MLSPKNNLQHIQLSDTTGTSNGTGFYGQMKLKKYSFLAANTQDGFGEHRDKKYPMCTMKYTAVCLMLWAYISAGPGHLVWTHGITDSIKYQQIKNQKVTDSVRNLVMGHVWIFQTDNNPKTNLKNNTKMGHWAQNQASAMAIPVL